MRDLGATARASMRRVLIITMARNAAEVGSPTTVVMNAIEKCLVRSRITAWIVSGPRS